MAPQIQFQSARQYPIKRARESASWSSDESESFTDSSAPTHWGMDGRGWAGWAPLIPIRLRWWWQISRQLRWNPVRPQLNPSHWSKDNGEMMMARTRAGSGAFFFVFWICFDLKSAADNSMEAVPSIAALDADAWRPHRWKGKRERKEKFISWRILRPWICKWVGTFAVPLWLEHLLHVTVVGSINASSGFVRANPFSLFSLFSLSLSPSLFLSFSLSFCFENELGSFFFYHHLFRAEGTYLQQRGRKRGWGGEGNPNRVPIATDLHDGGKGLTGPRQPGPGHT